MLKGDYQRGLGLFQDAEKVDPTYVYGTELRAGVLSYLGRTQYLTGNYAQARQTLEKAVSQHRSDDVARLYLGLTLYRLGDQKAALTNARPFHTHARRIAVARRRCAQWDSRGLAPAAH